MRVLSTYTASLPRPRDVVSPLIEEQARHGIARTALDAATQHAVTGVVSQQAAHGMEVISEDTAHPSVRCWQLESCQDPGNLGKIRLAEVGVCTEC